jgi:hypothetical protein
MMCLLVSCFAECGVGRGAHDRRLQPRRGVVVLKRSRTLQRHTEVEQMARVDGIREFLVGALDGQRDPVSAGVWTAGTFP